jgi:hypothetical protein
MLISLSLTRGCLSQVVKPSEFDWFSYLAFHLVSLSLIYRGTIIPFLLPLCNLRIYYNHDGIDQPDDNHLG